MNKEHKVLKFFMPLLSCIYFVLIGFICGSVMEKEFNILRSLFSIFLEILVVVLTVFIIKKLLPKVFPQAKKYKFTIPPAYILISIFLIVPLWYILKYELIYLVMSHFTMIKFEYSVCTTKELKENLIACISAFFLAPIYEELSCRYLGLSAFNKKSSQLIFGFFIAVFFGIMHLSNAMGAFMDAIILMLLFVFTENIAISIWFHSCWNIHVITFYVLILLGVCNASDSSYPSIIRIESSGTIIASVVSAIIGIVIFATGYRKKRNSEKLIST